MGLIVNKAVTFATGRTLSTGWYINCKSPFRDGDTGDNTNMPIKIYKSKADKDAGKEPLQVHEIDLPQSYTADVTVSDINTNGWFTSYYAKLKTELGTGNNLNFVEADVADDI